MTDLVRYKRHQSPLVPSVVQIYPANGGPLPGMPG